jgi:hypothetical protein
VEDAGAALAAAGLTLSAGFVLSLDFAPSPELAVNEAELSPLLPEPPLSDPLPDSLPDPSPEDAAGLCEA